MTIDRDLRKFSPEYSSYAKKKMTQVCMLATLFNSLTFRDDLILIFMHDSELE